MSYKITATKRARRNSCASCRECVKIRVSTWIWYVSFRKRLEQVFVRDIVIATLNRRFPSSTLSSDARC